MVAMNVLPLGSCAFPGSVTVTVSVAVLPVIKLVVEMDGFRVAVDCVTVIVTVLPVLAA